MTLRDQLARFHAAITGGAPLDSARELVDGDDALARLRVYEYAYTARIAGVLAHDYPKLATLVDFRVETARYLRRFPPSSFTLREAGAHLADFFATEAPLADLARLERARTEVFDGPDATPLARDDLAALDPAEFPALRLRLVPSSRVVALATNADDVWDAIEDGRPPPAAAAGVRTVLVWRRDVTVVHRTLDADEARVAPDLAAGTTFGAICEVIESPERAIELLVRWLDAETLRR